MTKPDDEAQRLREQLHRNQIITAAIAAVLVAFVVATYLGAFSKAELKEIPPWVSALTSVVAATISAYAVYLVAQTLRSTQEMLSLTRDMAEDQKKLVHTQIRPWVLLDNIEVSGGMTGLAEVTYLRYKIKNYGHTPARYAIVTFRVNVHSEYFDVSKLSTGKVIGQFEFENKEYAYMIPNGEQIGGSIKLADAARCGKNFEIIIGVDYYGMLTDEFYETKIIVGANHYAEGIYKLKVS
ncbi:hypothetical protein [Paracoccus yeei]|uniref:hypothetical protein n=1 Tax=Paracoccus yeei TaxID=147645 RepID=UPI00174BF9DD|nr:hypothetical protein [Paracoccus yeei]